MNLAVVIALLVTLATSAAGSIRIVRSKLPGKAPGVLPRGSRLLSLDRNEVERLIARIGKADAPAPAMSAMCYRMAPVETVVEYICPACGGRTLYPTGFGRMAAEDLPECRVLMTQLDSLSDIDMELEESSLCSTCGTDGEEAQLVLRVTWEDGVSACTAVTSDDLRVLVGFLSGDLTFETAYDGRELLKPFLLRIRDLLGVFPEDPLPVSAEKGTGK